MPPTHSPVTGSLRCNFGVAELPKGCWLAYLKCHPCGRNKPPSVAATTQTWVTMEQLWATTSEQTKMDHICLCSKMCTMCERLWYLTGTLFVYCSLKLAETVFFNATASRAERWMVPTQDHNLWGDDRETNDISSIWQDVLANTCVTRRWGTLQNKALPWHEKKKKKRTRSAHLFKHQTLRSLINVPVNFHKRGINSNWFHSLIHSLKWHPFIHMLTCYHRPLNEPASSDCVQSITLRCL